jgi:2-keto-4-pentenoate hydratase/2-oxohepta-3-ene-1,7-dioic acid hydratase in catechol pathway
VKLMRVGKPGAERPVLRTDDGSHLDLRGVAVDIDAEFLASGGIARVRRAYESGQLPATDVAGERIGAPVARPGVVLCLGLNYLAHAAESGVAPPTEPVVFYKAPNTVVGPYDELRLPPGAQKVDWEVELAVVIGSKARYLRSPADALACVAGYATSNDVSERDLQLARSGGQWSKGKSCETFNPLGPWLVSADEVTDPQDLPLASWVNGEARQCSSTRDMIFAVGWTVRHLSHVTVLEPGDVINTGTPQGVALSGRFDYLRAGDVVEVKVAGLGRQRTVCVPAPDVEEAGRDAAIRQRSGGSAGR